MNWGRLQRRVARLYAGGDADSFAKLSRQHYRRLLKDHPPGETLLVSRHKGLQVIIQYFQQLNLGTASFPYLGFYGYDGFRSVDIWLAGRKSVILPSLE